MIENDKHAVRLDKDDSVEPIRLPCRGCLPSCKNINLCEGKPWRVNEPHTNKTKKN